MTDFLSAVAGALAALLGLVRPLAAVPCLDPPRAPLVAMASPWHPSSSLGLPGHYTPMTGSEP